MENFSLKIFLRIFAKFSIPLFEFTEVHGKLLNRSTVLIQFTEVNGK